MADIRRTLDVAEEVSRDCHIPISCSISMPPCLFNRTRFKHLQFGYCAAGTDRAYYTLDPLGNLRPCNHSPRILGNIRHESFQEMAESPRMRDFVNARPPFCSGCALEKECQGSCKAAGEACYGSPWEMEPFLRHFMGEAEKPRERNAPRHPRSPVSETGAEPSRW